MISDVISSILLCFVSYVLYTKYITMQNQRLGVRLFKDMDNLSHFCSKYIFRLSRAFPL